MTILVGYTRTAEGQSALHHGLQAAASMGGKLAVFPLGEAGSAAGDDSALGAALDAGAVLMERDPDDHHPAQELLDTAAETGAELIVIGVRTRSRVSKVLLGSDAQSIILGSPVPVLTVKAVSDER